MITSVVMLAVALLLAFQTPASAAKFKNLSRLDTSQAILYPLNKKIDINAYAIISVHADQAGKRDFSVIDLSEVKDRSQALPTSHWAFEGGLQLDGAHTYESTHSMVALYSLLNGKIVEISGTIEAGDAEKFESFARRGGFFECKTPGRCPHSNVLMLNSPGGLFSEATKIADIVRKYNIVTVVERDKECLSACSLIFFSGYTDFEGYFFPRRFAHESARLGIHRPSVALPAGSGSYTAENLASMASYINSVASDVVSRFLPSGISLRLLKRMYETPSSSMHYLSTIEAMSEGVLVFGRGAVVRRLSGNAARYLCEQIYQSAYGISGRDVIRSSFSIDRSAFVSFESGRNFVCMGVRGRGGNWSFSYCLSDDCTLKKLGQVAIAKYGGQPWFDAASDIAVGIDNGTIGFAMRRAKAKDRLQYVRVFARFSPVSFRKLYAAYLPISRPER